MEDLIGDNIPQKVKREKKSINKSIYFAKIECKAFEQLGIDGNKITNLFTILKRAFSTDNDNYNIANDNAYSFSLDNIDYKIEIIENTEECCFGRLSTQKRFQDILEIYKADDEKLLKYVIIQYFTFFYIDINKKALIYIGQKGLKNINKLFCKYFETYAKEFVVINSLGNFDLINQINKANKLRSIEFKLADKNDVTHSLDETLKWDRNINDYNISIKVAKPSKNFIISMLRDRNKGIKIKNPIITFQDSAFNETITHLFEDYFTIKAVLLPSEIDTDNFQAIKNKLIVAMNTYME